MSSQDILLLTPGRPALYTTTRALFPVLLPTFPPREMCARNSKKLGLDNWSPTHTTVDIAGRCVCVVLNVRRSSLIFMTKGGKLYFLWLDKCRKDDCLVSRFIYYMFPCNVGQDTPLCMTCLLPGYLPDWVVSSPSSVSPPFLSSRLGKKKGGTGVQ